MKRQFWFIALFGIWCLISSLWYFFYVKGVSTSPEAFKPQVALVAIVEILVMLLVACLIGFAIAWWGRGEVIETQSEKLEELSRQNGSLVESNGDFKKQVDLWREKNQHDLTIAHQKLSELHADREKLLKAKNELESVVSEFKQERSDLRANLKQEENELGSLRYKIGQLEFKLKESEEIVSRQKRDIETLKLARKENTSLSDHPFVRPVEPDDKDNLTKIKGIGPFIEKRLNMIGIYTFEQLSELTPDMIDRVGAAIEFFPHRIIKDNWVGQARNFMPR